MIGTFLNVLGITVGGALGLTVGHRISRNVQSRVRLALAGLIVYAGFSMVWEGIRPPLSHAILQLAIGLLALCLGSATGHFLRLQRIIDFAGKWAVRRFAKTQAATAQVDPLQFDPRRWSEGFVTCSLIFCVGPMAILGSIQDGLDGHWQTLGLKGILDGLATLGFTATYGWGPILAAVPVLAYQGTLTLGARLLEPLVQGAEMKSSLGIAGGLIVACIAVVILELRKVPLANYLPALVYAPLLTWLWLA